MKVPRKTKQWAKEATDAMEIAKQIALKDMIATEGEALEKMFLYAPYICAKNRGIVDQDKITDMSEEIVGEKLEELQKFPETIENIQYKFFAGLSRLSRLLKTHP